MKPLVFTDLDGTLLDHHSYSTSISKKALQWLHRQDIPVVFCSSKTFEEQVYLQKKLAVHLPFIIENGSAIVWPTHYFPQQVELGESISDQHRMLVLAKADIRLIRQALRPLHLFGYTDSTDAAIAAATGLSRAAVKRARNRWFTETLLSPPPNQEARQMLEAAGLGVSQGGRFLTVQDQGIDKGRAVQVVTTLFSDHWRERPVTFGVGDSPNDGAMLAAVDHPFLVQRPDGAWANLDVPKMERLAAIGPRGFNLLAEKIASYG